MGEEQLSILFQLSTQKKKKKKGAYAAKAILVIEKLAWLWI